MKGNLGFGKTTFVRIFAKLLKSKDIISSPSFTLINEYDIILKNEEIIGSDKFYKADLILFGDGI